LSHNLRGNPQSDAIDRELGSSYRYLGSRTLALTVPSAVGPLVVITYKCAVGDRGWPTGGRPRPHHPVARNDSHQTEF
jgi:hypothetical protein